MTVSLDTVKFDSISPDLLTSAIFVIFSMMAIGRENECWNRIDKFVQCGHIRQYCY